MAYLSRFHDQQFDRLIVEAHSFACNDLGMNVVAADRVVVAGVDQAEAMRFHLSFDKSTKGGFDYFTGEVALIGTVDYENPDGARIKGISQILHELVHSGSQNHNEHPYFNEALAGIAERAFLQSQELLDNWRPINDYTLQKNESVINVPGDYRYYEPTTYTQPANTSNGLVASIGVRSILQQSSIKPTDVLAASSRDGTRQFEIMKHAIASVYPGLVDEIEQAPWQPHGVFKAASIVQRRISA
jgi:hypothetical protein